MTYAQEGPEFSELANVQELTAAGITWVSVRIYNHNPQIGDGIVQIEGPFDEAFGVQMRIPPKPTRGSSFVALNSYGVRLTRGRLTLVLGKDNEFVQPSDDFYIILKTNTTSPKLTTQSENVSVSTEFIPDTSLQSFFGE